MVEQRKCKDKEGHRSRLPRGRFTRTEVFEPNDEAVQAWFAVEVDQEGRRTPVRCSSAGGGAGSKRRPHSASPRPASCGPTGGAAGQTAPLGRRSPFLARRSSKPSLRKANSRSLLRDDDLLDMSLDDGQQRRPPHCHVSSPSQQPQQEEEEAVGLAYDDDDEEANDVPCQAHGEPSAAGGALLPPTTQPEELEGHALQRAQPAQLGQSFNELVMPAPVRAPGYGSPCMAPAGPQEANVCKDGGGDEGSSESEGEETEGELIRLRSWDKEEGGETEDGEDDWIMFADLQQPELLRAPSLRGNTWEGAVENGGEEDDAFLISDWEEGEGPEQREACVSVDGSADMLSASMGHEDEDGRSTDHDSELDVSFGQFSDLSAEEYQADDA